MVKRLISSLGRLASGAGSAAIGAAGELGKSINDEFIVSLINKLADKFEPVVVPVTCIPTGPELNDYKIEVDLTDFEAGLIAEKYVRPQIQVSATSMEIDRSILTDRLIETFSSVLKRHEKRMQELKTKKHRRAQKEQRDLTWSLTGMTVDFFLNAATLALLGMGALVGPLFFLLVAFGGLAILAELPGLAMNVLKRAVGIRVYDGPEDEELHRLEQELQRYRPLLEKMVNQAHIIEDPDLAEEMATFLGV